MADSSSDGEISPESPRSLASSPGAPGTERTGGGAGGRGRARARSPVTSDSESDALEIDPSSPRPPSPRRDPNPRATPSPTNDSDGEISDDDVAPPGVAAQNQGPRDPKNHDPAVEEISEDELENQSDAGKAEDAALENISDDDDFDLTTDDRKVSSPHADVTKTGLDDHGELDYDDEVQHPALAPPQASVSDVRLAAEEGEDVQEERGGADDREDISSEDEAPLDEPKVDEEEEEVGSEEGEVAESRDGSEDGEIADDGDEYDVTLGRGRNAYGRDSANLPCRFFLRGACTWGDLCKFLHPGNNRPEPAAPLTFGSEGIALKDLRRRYETNTETNDISVEREVTPPPAPAKVETAWERGLRQAKELMKKSQQRKETEPDLEEKRMNLSIEDVSKEPEKHPYYDQESNDEVHYGDDDADNVAEARESWHGGLYENFEIRYIRDADTSPPPSRHRSATPSDRGAMPRGGRRGARYQGDGGEMRPPRVDLRSGNTPPPMGKIRADEWRDPWRRSKSPKIKRTDSVSPDDRARGRRRRGIRTASYTSSGSSRSSRSSSYSSRSSSRTSSSSSGSSRGRGRPLPYPKRRRDRQAPQQQPLHPQHHPMQHLQRHPNRQMEHGGREPGYHARGYGQDRRGGYDRRGGGGGGDRGGGRGGVRERGLDIPRRPTEGMYSRQRLGSSPPRGAHDRERRMSEQSRERDRMERSPRDHHPPPRDHLPTRDHHPLPRDHQLPPRDHHPPPRDHHPPPRDHIPPSRDHHPQSRDHHPPTRDHHPLPRDHHPPPRDHQPLLRDHHPIPQAINKPTRSKPPTKKPGGIKDPKAVKVERPPQSLPQESPARSKGKAESPPPPPPPSRGQKPTRPGPSGKQMQPSKADYKAAKAAKQEVAHKVPVGKLAGQKSPVKAVPGNMRAGAVKAVRAPGARPPGPVRQDDRARPGDKAKLDNRKRRLSSSSESISSISSSSSSASADSDHIYRDIKNKRKMAEKSTKTALAAAKQKPPPAKPPVVPKLTKLPPAKIVKTEPPRPTTKPAPKPDLKPARPEPRAAEVKKPKAPEPKADVKKSEKTRDPARPPSKPVQHVKPFIKAPESPKREVAKVPAQGAPVYKVAPKEVDDPSKAAPGKSSIKLTLVKKPVEKGVKRPAEATIGPPSKKPARDVESDKEKIKAKPAVPPPPPAKVAAVKKPEVAKPEKKKSAGTRREELLKQLKAVEDAIARKRSKT